jgi:hypothetical protein
MDDMKIHPQNVECGNMKWVHLVQERDRWEAAAIMVMNLEGP